MKTKVSIMIPVVAAFAMFCQQSAFSQAAGEDLDATIASIVNPVEEAEEVAPSIEPALAEVAVAEPAAVEVDVDESATPTLPDAVEPVITEGPAGETAETNSEVADEIAAIMNPELDAPAEAADPVAVTSVAAAEGDEIRVSMAFEDAPIEDVIRAFRDATGANIVSAWTNANLQPISMRLDNKEWKLGLNSIIASRGLELKEEPRDSGIYIVREKSTYVPTYTQTYELKHANAKEIADLLKSMLDASSLTVAFPAANTVVVKATETQLDECARIIKALDVPSRQVYIEARFIRLNSKASKQLGMKWDSLADFGITLENFKAGFQGAEGRLNALEYTTSSSTRSKEIDGYGPAPRRSPYIETKNHATLVPTSYDPKAAPTAGFTADDMSWNKASGYGGQISLDALRLAISAFEGMDGAQIFSNPKIIVGNEKTARIDMTTKRPNVEIDFQAATQTGQRDSISSKLAVIPGKNEAWVGEAFFSYGITLDVTPRISPTGLISVDIIPAISQLDGSVVVGVENAQNSYPVIKVQSLDTSFTMADGRTAVIGGLTETAEGNVDSGIPLLRHIPWIGPRLFGWKSREKSQNEIIIFVTVGLVDPTTITQDSGMPKNAVLGRGLLDGSLKEPGDRTDEEMFNLENKPARGYRIK